ncbi:MAG TPA: hypothetical protein VK934_00900 [Fimbriimonas sp.]|nr:hypothetical protein [Fimbriimonas sp.]
MKLRFLLKLWDASLNEDDSTIASMVNVQRSVSFYDAEGRLNHSQGDGYDGGPFLRFPEHDLPLRYPNTMTSSFLTLRNPTHRIVEDRPVMVKGELQRRWHLERSLSLSNYARLIVLEEVNMELLDGVCPAITLAKSEPYQLVPRDLLGCFYLLFMNEIVAGASAMQPCQCGCGEWFWPTTGQQRYKSRAHSDRANNRKRRQ